MYYYHYMYLVAGRGEVRGDLFVDGVDVLFFVALPPGDVLFCCFLC